MSPQESRSGCYRIHQKVCGGNCATQLETEQDGRRKAELEELARVSDKISSGKPETFFEAIQLVWYTHLIANLANGCAMSFSRFDQYMFPFYRDDLEAGRITPERARELICALFYKMNDQKCVP
jgi:formate C-acetyltransferase